MTEQLHITHPAETSAQPRIVYGSGAEAITPMDPEAAAQTLRELGVTENAIADTTVYIDPHNRLLNHGTHYSQRQGRLRFLLNPDLRDAPGEIIRLSASVRGKQRTSEQMNRTFVHEGEHLAQSNRHDKKVTEGHIAIYGLAALGAIAGNRLLGKAKKGKIGAAVGASMGYQIGYRLAPHERQARKRAGQVRGKEPQVVSTAIKRVGSSRATS